MSAPKFDVWNIQLGDPDEIKATYVGRVTHEDVLKHPSGLVIVLMDGATWIRSDKNPVWEKLDRGKKREVSITITTIAPTD
jgi:hypothetical protein